jgi:hypothetical protein
MNVNGRKYPSEKVRIEGGLGSQILTFSKFLYAKNHLNLPKVSADYTYFTEPKIEKNHSGLSFWPWSLDSYGYKLNELIEQDSRKLKNSRFFKSSQTQILDSDVWNWLKINPGVFPLDTDSLRLSLVSLKIPEGYNVIHIRRGDYVRISALITEHSSYLQLLSRIMNSLEKVTLIFSDDDIEESIQEQYVKILGAQTRFISSSELSDLQTHNLMRNATNLITANSTFSISAALLNGVAKSVLSPVSYVASEKNTNGFIKMGDWFYHS